MANEKFLAAQSIIKKITNQNEVELQMMDEKYQNKASELITKHEFYLKNKQKEDLDTLKKELNLALKKESSSLKQALHQSLLEAKQKDFQSFEEEIKEEILIFKNTPEYKTYLEDCIQSVKEDITKIFLDSSDLHYYENAEPLDLPLGGILIETENKIYDFSLQEKLNKEIKTLQTQTHLNVEGGTYE